MPKSNRRKKEQHTTCPSCGGSGEISSSMMEVNDHECNHCHGKGFIKAPYEDTSAITDITKKIEFCVLEAQSQHLRHLTVVPILCLSLIDKIKNLFKDGGFDTYMEDLQNSMISYELKTQMSPRIQVVLDAVEKEYNNTSAEKIYKERHWVLELKKVRGKI